MQAVLGALEDLLRALWAVLPWKSGPIVLQGVLKLLGCT